MTMRTEPKYEHDCDRCRFVGHFFRHDVYVCTAEPADGGACPDLEDSVLARYGNEQHEYASQTVGALLESIASDSHKIQFGNEAPLHFREQYLFSDESLDYAKAMTVGVLLFPWARTIRKYLHASARE